MKKEETEEKSCTVVKTEAIQIEAVEAKDKAETKVKAEGVGSGIQRQSKTKVGKNNNNSKWQMRFDQCKAFAETMGHCKIPTNYGDNKSLGIWVQEQRRNYKLIKQGKEPRFKMTDEQMERLDSIGFHWGYTPDPNGSAESDASWDNNFHALVGYRNVHGNFDVPVRENGTTMTTTTTTLTRLATWTRVQRNQKYRRDSKLKCFINKKRIDKLTAIGFDWDGPRKLD